MIEHVTTDELTQHYYGIAGSDAAAGLDAHLRSCGRCRALWTELVEVLALVDRTATPDPGPEFERVVWARLQPALAAPARPGWSLRQIAPLGAWAALVVGMAAVQAAHLVTVTGPAPVDAIAAEDAARAGGHRRVLFTALNEHFAQTEMLLVEVMNGPEDGRPEFAFERNTAADLVASGRLYRSTAWGTGDLHLVAVLDDLEAVLVDVAHGPAQAHSDLTLLRARIDAADLLFKVRAVTTELRGPHTVAQTESE